MWFVHRLSREAVGDRVGPRYDVFVTMERCWLLFCFGFCLFSLRALAYPEYAVRNNMVSCTACHISPVGGGPRTVNGKLFGAHNYKMNPILAQEYVSADFRTLFYYPQRAGASKDGMGVMAGSVGGHVALDEDKRVHLVIEHNVAGFSAGQFRDTYAMFKFSDEGRSGWADSLLVGRFRVPFGIVTDEHRTYTRIQTGTEWYTFETGLLFSGTPSDTLHYDVGLVSGENSAGQSLPQGEAERWGGVVNVRWMPGPALFGASALYHNHDPSGDSSWAGSIYSIWSVGRWTNDRVPLTIQVEHTRAWGSINHIGQGFASDPAYVSAVARSQSLGWMGEADWQFSQHFWVLYKFDWLAPDRDYPSDYYVRHGFGVRWFLAANVMLQLRTEFAQATPPSEAGSTAVGAQDASYALLQLAL